MADAREESEWWRTASVLAVTINASRDMLGAWGAWGKGKPPKPVTPAELHPMFAAKTPRPVDIPITMQQAKAIWLGKKGRNGNPGNKPDRRLPKRSGH